MLLDDLLDLLLQLRRDVADRDLREELALRRGEVRAELGLPLRDLVDGDGVEETVDTSEDKGNHLIDGHGRVLLLLEELGQL